MKFRTVTYDDIPFRINVREEEVAGALAVDFGIFFCGAVW